MALTDKLGIVADNFKNLYHEQTELNERLFAHIQEKAELLASDFNKEEFYFTSDNFRERYCNFKDSCRFKISADTLPLNRKGVNDFNYSDSVNEHVYLCECLIDLYNKYNNTSVIPEMFFGEIPSATSQSRIAYIRNSYADIAYNKFSRVLSEPTVMYCQDFNGVCEDTYYGRAALCILPIENSIDGKLVRFRNLINKYDLKIVLTCLVETADNNYTKFALLKKNIECLHFKTELRGQDFFEFSVTLPDTFLLENILSAARCCGLRLYRIDSVPVSYTDREYSYDIVFITNGSDINSFLCYLCVETPQFTPVGLFNHLVI